MSYPRLFETDPTEARVAHLEARIEALERLVARLSVGVSPAEALARTQRLPVLAAAPEADTRTTLDRLGITASFATLDLRLAQAAAEEAAPGRKPAFVAPEIQIDASLIDRAFARPPPQKLEVRCDLENLHPRIMERIAATWRTPELLAYLKRLIVDERGDRAGFSAEVMSELLLLSGVLEAPVEADKWNANARTV